MNNEEYLQEEFEESQCLDTSVCEICSRKFHCERIAKHRDVCEKAAKKQLEREKLIKKKQLQKAEQQQKLQAQEKLVQKNNQWREQHKQFQEMIHQNRETGRTIKTPEIVVNSNYVHCEYCLRNFAPNVADTHIPKCKEIKHKPKPPKKPAKDELKRPVQLSTASTNGNDQLNNTKKSLKPLMKTAELQKRQLPELKKAIYTGFGSSFMDCQTRATALSDTECPHCFRRFNNKAALRHIPICEKLTNKEQFKLKLKHKPPLQKRTQPLLPAILTTQNRDLQIGSCFCTQCGTKMQSIHKYCGSCGHKRIIEI